jgi:hypothetical protein
MLQVHRHCAPPVGAITFDLISLANQFVLAIAPSALPLEVAPSVVPIEELNCLSSPASMLPTALSEVLGISLDEVMQLYFDGSEESLRVHRVEEALD